MFQRPLVPADKCKWTIDYPEYKPIEYTAPIVLSNPSWADPSNPTYTLNSFMI